MPHGVPAGFHLDPEHEVIKIGRHAFEGGKERLYIRHLRINPNAAFVDQTRLHRLIPVRWVYEWADNAPSTTA